MTNSCDSSSLTTAAVRPAAVLAFPLVYTARGLNSSTALRRKKRNKNKHILKINSDNQQFEMQVLFEALHGLDE